VISKRRNRTFDSLGDSFDHGDLVGICERKGREGVEIRNERSRRDGRAREKGRGRGKGTRSNSPASPEMYLSKIVAFFVSASLIDWAS